MIQPSLFEGDMPVTRHHACEYCGGAVVVSRTADWFEDDWRCQGCGVYGNVSWSRVFGPRAEELSQGGA